MICETTVSARQAVLAWEAQAEWQTAVGFPTAAAEPDCEDGARAPGCVVEIYLGVAALPASDGVSTVGVADLRSHQVTILPGMNDADFQIVATHEIGHILMDARQHLEDVDPTWRGVVSNRMRVGHVTADDVAMLCMLQGMGCP